ncbi:dihydroflavonol-4-reductase [Tistlia consotensis]|uniref:Dihydroflavonol-4-reductase n=1 Tax=Tistlia consotensis USBA 355 TaxID=560819 RepID=A0A1Y6B7X6_9PROT|nr:hopanoid-associated sugar epimerase [Tistlia consotensis]SME93301.1 dihydroflavonol-4-reductase [Tistlia consotensis USBA 355]SNR28589.1 dihydroflavonol-4-reductase [Tistlia consotensis]
MTVLVTGASGFVGAAVARHLLAEGAAVRVMTRSTSDPRNLEGLPVERVTGDLTDRASLDRAVAGCDSLFHVAADYRLWIPDPEAMLAANVEGTVNLMTAAGEAGVGRIVYTSSVAVLGLRGDGGSADETTPSSLADMIGAYKRSKFLAEAAVRRMVAEQGLPCVIVNPSTPIGPRDLKPTPTGRLVVEAARGRMPAVVDTGLNVVHVDDVAAGHLLAYARGTPGERYLLGGDNMTLFDIVGLAAREGGKAPPRARLPHALILPFAYLAEGWAKRSGREPFATVDGLRMARKKMWFSSAKAEDALGYRHRPGAEAIRDAVAWFRERGYLG